MRFEEKLRKQMLLKGYNQQKLARLSGVSDSEVSRILGGKSQPGLENALRLARAVGVSLDYLADDAREVDAPGGAGLSSWETEIQDLSREIGARNAAQLLLAVRTLGFDAALRRLYGMEPRPAAETDNGEGAANISPLNSD